MSLESRLINKEEENIRKNWLFATCFYLVLYPLLLFAFFAIASEQIHIPEDTLYEFLSYAAAGLIPLWIIWHCAYRKYGTGLLTLCLVVVPFRTLLSFIDFFKGPCNAWTIGFTALDLAVYGWWYFTSLKLRKINKKLQLVQAPNACKEALMKIREPETLEDLDLKFNQAVTEWPRHEPLLSREYKAQRSELLYKKNLYPTPTLKDKSEDSTKDVKTQILLNYSTYEDFCKRFSDFDQLSERAKKTIHQLFKNSKNQLQG